MLSIDHISPLPELFRTRYEQAFGKIELASLEHALTKPISASLRCHPRKGFTPNLRSVPWCENGFFTDRSVLFGADPIWYAGGYYVQEPASMIIGQYIHQYGINPKRALDLCAAPGGKSTLLRGLLPEKTVLISNEPDTGRAKILKENFTRWGMEETIITSTLPQKMAQCGISFELILVDAPCSGEGMFRKEMQALSEWSIENVHRCVARQHDILDAAWEMLQEDGILIYSTCTYNREENEEQLNYLMRKGALKVLPLQLDPDWGIRSEREGVYRFAPNHTESEGLTIFAIHKKEGHTGQKSIRKSTQKGKIPEFLQHCFQGEENTLYQHNEEWYYLSQSGQELLSQLNNLKILSGGVCLGELKGKDFIPDIAWVLSPLIQHRLPFPKYEIDSPTALKYLKRETITMDGEKGIYIITYRGIPLGLVKHLGNRTNNLYPKELMIRNSNLTLEDLPVWE